MQVAFSPLPCLEDGTEMNKKLFVCRWGILYEYYLQLHHTLVAKWLCILIPPSPPTEMKSDSTAQTWAIVKKKNTQPNVCWELKKIDINELCQQVFKKKTFLGRISLIGSHMFFEVMLTVKKKKKKGERNSNLKEFINWTKH